MFVSLGIMLEVNDLKARLLPVCSTASRRSTVDLQTKIYLVDGLSLPWITWVSERDRRSRQLSKRGEESNLWSQQRDNPCKTVRRRSSVCRAIRCPLKQRKGEKGVLEEPHDETRGRRELNEGKCVWAAGGYSE